MRRHLNPQGCLQISLSLLGPAAGRPKSPANCFCQLFPIQPIFSQAGRVGPVWRSNGLSAGRAPFCSMLRLFLLLQMHRPRALVISSCQISCPLEPHPAPGTRRSFACVHRGVGGSSWRNVVGRRTGVDHEVAAILAGNVSKMRTKKTHKWGPKRLQNGRQNVSQMGRHLFRKWVVTFTQNGTKFRRQMGCRFVLKIKENRVPAASKMDQKCYPKWRPVWCKNERPVVPKMGAKTCPKWRRNLVTNGCSLLAEMGPPLVRKHWCVFSCARSSQKGT